MTSGLGEGQKVLGRFSEPPLLGILRSGQLRLQKEELRRGALRLSIAARCRGTRKVGQRLVVHDRARIRFD